MPGSDGLVRCVEIKTKCGMLVRPVHKVCLLESSLHNVITDFSFFSHWYVHWYWNCVWRQYFCYSCL